jgi:hypothetical protein
VEETRVLTWTLLDFHISVICVYRNMFILILLQLFVGRRMSYLRYLCLSTWMVSTTYCVVLLFFFFSSCVPYFAVSLECRFFDCPLGIL